MEEVQASLQMARESEAATLTGAQQAREELDELKERVATAREECSVALQANSTLTEEVGVGLTVHSVERTHLLMEPSGKVPLIAAGNNCTGGSLPRWCAGAAAVGCARRGG